MKRLNLLGVAALLLLAATHANGEKPLTREEQKARLEKAEALFKEHCKTAGEFIKRTADDVEGIYLLKLRPSEINRGNQFDMDDPYGRDFGGEGYLQSFLRGFWDNSRAKKPTLYTPSRLGYQYVEATDPKDGKRYRYTGSRKVVGQMDRNAPNVQSALKTNPNIDISIYAFVMDKTPASGPSPRYGVTYDDISTRDDRELWIAGSSLKVIDLKKNEVIAERIGYMMDRGQGANGGGRAPWLIAADNACPAFIATHGSFGQAGQTEKFVEKTLHPIQEK
jgi:hypothetical protein